MKSEISRRSFLSTASTAVAVAGATQLSAKSYGRGYRGTLEFTKTGWVARDKDLKVLAEHTKTGGEDQNLHHTNLHNHLRNGEALNCPIELGMAGVFAVNMANESWRTSQMMGWDAANEKMVPANTLKMSHEPE